MYILDFYLFTKDSINAVHVEYWVDSKEKDTIIQHELDEYEEGFVIIKEV